MQSIRRRKVKDKSTETKFAYIFDHILYGAICGFDVYKFLPLVAPIAYYEQSVLRVIFCMVLTSVVGISFTYGNNRTAKGTLVDILSGMGLYVALTVGVYTPRVLEILFWVTGVFTVIGLALIVFHTVKRRKSLKQIVISRMVRSVLLIRRNMGVAAAFVLILVPVSLNFTSSDVIMEIFNEKEGYESTLKIGEADYEKYSRYEEYGLKDNFDTIRMIYDDASWTALTMEEKKEVIIKICYCECRYLGIDCDVNLVFTDELEEEIGGLYDDSNRTIYYNNISLEKDNEDAFLVIAEEVFHCYQHELARLYVKLSPAERNLLCFEKCEGWLKNMDSYIAGGETEEEYIAYRTQPLEKDAKKYAYDSWGDYQYEIEILLNERNKEKDT